MSEAYEVYEKTRGLAAFNIAPARVVRKVRNQHGTRYIFADSSALFVARDLAAKAFAPCGICQAARTGPGGRYTETRAHV